MSTIQPGDGYNLSASSSGFTLDINKPWTPPIGDPMLFALQLGNTRQLPEQLVYNIGVGGKPAPFECQILSVAGLRYLQIGVGAIGYTSSFMPIIKSGADTRIMQAFADKVQICPSGTRTYGDINPISPYQDPSYNPEWYMEAGGGYLLADTNDPITLWAFKWDVDVGVAPFSSSSVVNTGLPTLALIATSNTADTNKVTVDPGPSVYVQTMNVQKMLGYDAASTGLPFDWGHCHTSWLNPRKLGYSYKAIADITATANTFAMTCVQERPGIPMVQNQVQRVLLVGRASGGAAYISIGASTSVIPFPVTDVPPIYSNELTLAECLNSIPGITLTIDGEPVVFSLTGNVEVSRTTENSYYVTFCNELAGLNVPLLSFNTAGVTAYAYDFIIKQYHTGNIDLTTPMQAGMVQLRNVANEDESSDPYNVNEAANWDQIANKAECVACTGFSGDVTTSGMLQMTSATNISVQYDGGSCTPEPGPVTPDHPYKVYLMSSGGGSNVWAIVYGETNNVPPTNIASTITLGAGSYEVWIKHPYLSPNYPDTTGFNWAMGATMPADTDTDGYIRIANISGTTVTQIVTGSLWSDRIKLGTITAEYYFARV